MPQATSARRHVLLDRDGTIIEDRDYLRDPAEVMLIPGAAEGLRQLSAAGLGLIVLSNQSGVGRGYFAASDVESVHTRLREMLAAEGVALDGIYFCPHAPDDACDCRKPETGLVRSAVADLKFDPRRCFVVGDKAADMALGRRIGAATVLVRTGYGTAQAAAAKADTDRVVDDLNAAASVILEIVAAEKQREAPR